MAYRSSRPHAHAPERGRPEKNPGEHPGARTAAGSRKTSPTVPPRVGKREGGNRGISGEAGLRPQAPPEKLAALNFEHARLLKAIATRKRDLARLDDEIQETARRLVQVEPIRDETIRADREIHGLFRQLLARRGQARDVRRGLRLVYDLLRDRGVLSADSGSDDPDEELQKGDDEDHPHPRGARGGRGAGADGASSHQPPPEGAGGFSARRPSDAPQDQTLRGLFRRLAMAVHPDRTTGEAEKARRTEAMKEISRAYAERDLARLLNLERTWMADGALDASAGEDDLARKLAHLERLNRELRTQLAELARAIKKLRRSPAGQMQLELRRAAQQASRRRTGNGGPPDPIDRLVDEARTALEGLRSLRAFVIRFRDGKLTLEEFLRGPMVSTREGRGADAPFGDGGFGHGEENDDDDDLLDELVLELFEEGLGGPSRPSRRRRRGGRRASGAGPDLRGNGRRPGGRASRANDDVPF